MARGKGARVLVDEVYKDVSGDPSPPAAARGDTFVTTSSLTKSTAYPSPVAQRERNRVLTSRRCPSPGRRARRTSKWSRRACAGLRRQQRKPDELPPVELFAQEIPRHERHADDAGTQME